MSFIGNAAFRMAEWRVDPALDELARDGKTVKLEPRTMRVLVCLAEHAGEVVSVKQLLDTVWKDLVVTQSSVYEAVAILRRELGDDRKDPIYIASVLRRGYRLVAPIDMDGQMPAKDPLEQVAPVPSDRGLVLDRRAGLRYAWVLIALLAVAGSALGLISRLGRESGPPATTAATLASRATTPTKVPFAPPPHSIAVLPFVNLSGDPDQQYFSDGLTEELLTSLTRIDDLQVAARTSSFSFQGEHPDIAAVARKLNVASVLEGSVRRSGNTIRVTAQLINATTGFHLWSQTYNRDLGDILKLQTDIADAVASALKVTLLGDVFAKIELGGTHNPAAFDAYLRGANAREAVNGPKEEQATIAAYTEAIRLDPNYALAFAGRARAYTDSAGGFVTGTEIRESFDKAQADAREATRLAPELPEAHIALGQFYELGSLDFPRAREAYERALALAPGSASVLRASGNFLANMGAFDEAISAARRAATLDPLNRRSYHVLGNALYFAHRYRDAIQAYTESITLNPALQESYPNRGFAYYGLHDLENARSSCEIKPDYWLSQQCLAVVYDKLGLHAKAEAVLAKYQAAQGNAGAYQYATIYAQWGNRDEALQWLTTAMRLRDPGLAYLKTDPLMDPLRNEPRFQAIERELKFPN